MGPQADTKSYQRVDLSQEQINEVRSFLERFGYPQIDQQTISELATRISQTAEVSTDQVGAFVHGWMCAKGLLLEQ